jgi:hypothetical protein
MINSFPSIIRGCTFQAWKKEQDELKDQFCADNNLDRKVMNEVKLREEEIRTCLVRAGFIVPADLAPEIPASEAVVFLKVNHFSLFSSIFFLLLFEKKYRYILLFRDQIRLQSLARFTQTTWYPA